MCGEGKIVGKRGKVGIGLISMNVNKKFNNTNKVWNILGFFEELTLHCHECVEKVIW